MRSRTRATVAHAGLSPLLHRWRVSTSFNLESCSNSLSSSALIATLIRTVAGGDNNKVLEGFFESVDEQAALPSSLSRSPTLTTIASSSAATGVFFLTRRYAWPNSWILSAISGFDLRKCFVSAMNAKAYFFTNWRLASLKAPSSSFSTS